MTAELEAVLIMAVIVIAVGGAGIAVGMLLAPRIGRLAGPDDPVETSEETGDQGTH